MTAPPLPEQVELHRDRMWRRDEDLRVETGVDADRFIEEVGLPSCAPSPQPSPSGRGGHTLTDARRAGLSFRHRGVRSAGC